MSEEIGTIEEETMKIRISGRINQVPTDKHCGEYKNGFWTKHMYHSCVTCNAPFVNPNHCLRDKCWNGEKCGYDDRSFC